VSGQRAKRKQRQRARAAAGERASTAAPSAQRPSSAAPAAEAQAPRRSHEPATAPAAAPRHPSRLDVRDGIARPDAIWAPFPLTEIAMGVGIVLFLAGAASGGAGGAWLLGIGVVVLAVAVAELCLREHFAGFRSHSLLLGLLPVTAVHTLVVLLVTTDWHGPLALVVDLAAAAGLAWWLQARFRAAQERALRRSAT
jgi:hypothetical protein